MTGRSVGLAVAAVVISCVSVSSASALPRKPAADEGLVGLHDLRRERGHICMSDHPHIGTSYGATSKKAGERAAIADWAGFTAWEYGPRWASFKIAGSRTVTCTSAGGNWSCEAKARPCR